MAKTNHLTNSDLIMAAAAYRLHRERAPSTIAPYIDVRTWHRVDR
jgi:hypothetical protein